MIKFFTGLAFILLALTPMTHAQQPTMIKGPWLWVALQADIKPRDPQSWNTHAKRHAVANRDYLAVASAGAVTEQQVAALGAMPNSALGNTTWKSGSLADDRQTRTIGNNINTLVLETGTLLPREFWTDGDNNELPMACVDNSVFYGLVTLHADTAIRTLLHVGHDDMAKIWINGAVVYDNPTFGNAGGFQEFFEINLNAGENLLMLKVNNTYGAWAAYIGIEENVTSKPIVAEPVATRSSTRAAPRTPGAVNKFSFVGVSLGRHREVEGPENPLFVGLHSFYDMEIRNRDATWGLIGNIEYAAERKRTFDPDGIETTTTYETFLLTGCVSHGFKIDSYNHIRLGIGATYVGARAETSFPTISNKDWLPTAQFQWTITARPVREREWAATMSVIWRQEMGLLFTITPGILMRYIDNL